ncbi:MAG: hypothetical protein KatS3mg119_1458 [Rhodothalassiaceae bacterium]|nr:MAG: hypothetical protein KatS3mg119_1458 [Rhodothalassiaceae bacterium]
MGAQAAEGPAPRPEGDAGDPKAPEAYRTIGEVSELVGVPQHVLRFWETRFPQLKPLKRSGNRRYYRPDDVALLQAIRVLLHEQGMTIRGVQKRLKAEGRRRLVAAVLGAGPAAGGPAKEAAGAPRPAAERTDAPAEPVSTPPAGDGRPPPAAADILARLRRIRALLDR